MKPFTNIHAHVFNSSCAPDNFLRILPMNFIRRIPGTVKTLLDSKAGRTLVHLIAKSISKRDSNKRREFDKYIAFLDVGLQNSQLDIFRMAFDHGQQFDPSVRIIGLTMNMDYMDSKSSQNQKPFETQLEQVKDIKRFYPRNFFPFLGIDPRHKGGVNMVSWARDYFETGVTDKQTGTVYPYFCGIKLYPALGFFPFDPRLKELYAYAEQNEIPVMTHTTRVGSQYIGAQIESLISKAPDMIGANLNANTVAAKSNIINRIAAFYDREWVKNSSIGNNDFACDLFGHPENYILLLENFPKLKICLAHMGGSNEILSNPSDPDVQKVRKVDNIAWFNRIQNMMIEYPNLYTDISYTLSSFGDKGEEVINKVRALLGMNDRNGQPLAKRVLFGTDFFMTEQEARETELYALAKEKLAQWFDLISRDNPQDFIRQPL